MRMFFSSMLEIQLFTLQLLYVVCPHCQSDQHLLSHGFIYRKQGAGKSPIAVGKRIYCSNRHQHQGCGRTCPLYLASVLRFIHYSAATMTAFVLALLSGLPVEQAYCQATSCDDSRQAWRWRDKWLANLPRLRAQLSGRTADAPPDLNHRTRLIGETFDALQQRFAPNVIAGFQTETQRGLLLPISRLLRLTS